ncbi:MAG: hypothetical protein LM557_04380 [Desulfurococcaceae archaeon]|nr:hypothetical protein [Desulfurococcaceae archaeon]
MLTKMTAILLMIALLAAILLVYSILGDIVLRREAASTESMNVITAFKSRFKGVSGVVEALRIRVSTVLNETRRVVSSVVSFTLDALRSRGKLGSSVNITVTVYTSNSTRIVNMYFKGNLEGALKSLYRSLCIFIEKLKSILRELIGVLARFALLTTRKAVYNASLVALYEIVIAQLV